MSAFNDWFSLVLQDQQSDVPTAAPGPFRPPQWAKPQLYSITAVLPGQPTATVSTKAIGGIDVPEFTTTEPGTPSSSTTYFFDAVLRADHDQSLRVTEHPVQNGASIVDHAYLIPARVTLDIGMSDAMDSFVAGQYTSAASKSVSAYQTMKYLQKLRIPLTLATRLDEYTNMVIENIRASDTVATVMGARMLISFRQIILGTVATNSISARPDQSSATNEGTKSPQNVPPDLSTFMSGTGMQPQWNSNTKPN